MPVTTESANQMQGKLPNRFLICKEYSAMLQTKRCTRSKIIQIKASAKKTVSILRVPYRIFGIRDLVLMELGIRDYIEKLKRDSGLHLCTARGI